jgi:hypothetical protein
MVHQQMLVLLQTVHIKMGALKKKNFTQANEKLEAAFLVICTTTARDTSYL